VIAEGHVSALIHSCWVIAETYSVSTISSTATAEFDSKGMQYRFTKPGALGALGFLDQTAARNINRRKGT
jgi:hypothetical protein